MYDARTGDDFTDAEAEAIMEHFTPEAVDDAVRFAEEHRARVAAYEATLPKAKGNPHGVKVVRRGSRSPKPVPIDALTGAQRLKRWVAEDMLALEKRVQESGLWDGIPRSRRSWCARLRELELHPEREAAIRARIPNRHRPPQEIRDEVRA